MIIRLIFRNIAIFLFLTTCLPFFASGQSVPDSLALTQEIDSLIKVSGKMFEDRKQEEALQLITEVITKSENAFGKRHPSCPVLLGAKGAMLLNMRKYTEAESILEEACSLQEIIGGKDNATYARLLYNFGTTCMRTTKPANAIKALEEAQQIFEKTGSEKDEKYCRTLLNLSFLYQNSGQYEKAEAAILKAKTILEETGRTNETTYLTALVNLGAVNYALLQYDKTITYFELAVEGFKRINQTENPGYSVVLTNLGFMYTERGEYEKSKTCYLESKNVLEKTVGKASPEYAQLALNIGGTYFYLKDYDNAEASFKESKEIYEQVGLANGVLYFRTWSNIGKIKVLKGLYTEAIPIYEAVLEGWAKEVGELDDFYLGREISLVDALMRAGRDDEAIAHLKHCALLEKKLLNRAGAYFSQKEIFDYLPAIAWTDDWLGPIARAQGGQNADLCRTFYDAVLFRKGYFLQSSQITNHLVESASVITQQIFSDWKNGQKQLVEIYAQPISGRNPGLDSVENRVNILEKQLIQNLPGFADARREIHWQEVQAALQPGEAAIEFVHFYDTLAKIPGNRYYAALLLIPGAVAPQFIPLFEKKECTRLTGRSRSWLQDFTENLYACRKNDTEKSLYQLIWEPLEPHLSGIKTIYYAPSGLLHRLNLEAIEKPDGSRTNTRKMVQLGSTRNVLPGITQRLSSNNALVFGGIQYDATPVAAITSNNTSLGSRNRSIDFSYDTADSTLRGNDWRYLPGTLSEVQKIETQLQKSGIVTEKRTGTDATEEAFKMRCESSQQSPRIIHIATHGFFFPDGQNAGDSTAIAFKTNENPMMRSGLILAGANHAWKTGKPKQADAEDGILTAYEISLMNLSNTELVVLSACETGLGDITGNEGVYGLQRAFKIAGAKYLIMSLWKVSDEQTEQLMTLFYQKWLTEKQPIPEAFRSAKAVMQAKYPNPFYWAGFVLLE